MEAYILSTNRTLIRVSGSASLKKLCVEHGFHRESETLEEFSSRHKYYAINLTSAPGGDIRANFENIMMEVFTEIFCNELSNRNVSSDNWPKVDDYEVFKTFFKIEQDYFSADFGQSPIKTTKTYLEV